jgi:transcription initiation factor TFIID subunit TAF12
VLREPGAQEMAREVSSALGRRFLARVVKFGFGLPDLQGRVQAQQQQQLQQQQRQQQRQLRAPAAAAAPVAAAAPAAAVPAVAAAAPRGLA